MNTIQGYGLTVSQAGNEYKKLWNCYITFACPRLLKGEFSRYFNEISDLKP